MKYIKCMNSCCYMNLKLGSYVVCFIFLLTSVTIAILLSTEITILQPISPTLQALLVVLTASHILLFFSTCCLLYGLCMEKPWPLLAFIPAAVIIAVNEAAIVCYIIINRKTLPSTAIATAASQTFILAAIIFSAMVIFSLYVQWHEDSAGGRPMASAELY